MRANPIEDAEPCGFPYMPGDSASMARRRSREDYREAEAEREARFALLCAAVAVRRQLKEEQEKGKAL